MVLLILLKKNRVKSKDETVIAHPVVDPSTPQADDRGFLFWGWEERVARWDNFLNG